MVLCNHSSPCREVMKSFKLQQPIAVGWLYLFRTGSEEPNQKFIVVATLRMVGNRRLWSIMLGNANEARKSWVGYSRLPTEFLILETQLQATMIIVGISKYTQHVCESGRNSSHLRQYPTLSRLSLAFPCITDDSIHIRYTTDYCLNFENNARTRTCWPCTHTHTRTHTHTYAHTRTHARTHAHARTLETIYRIIFQLNEIF